MLRTVPQLLALTLFAGAIVAVASPACDRYEPPPTPVLDGLVGQVLYDSKAPLAVELGQPVDPSTLSIKVAYDDTNIEGDLPDEDDDPTTDLRVLVAHDPVDGDQGGHLQLAADAASFQFVPGAALPVGPKLVLLVEPGLTGTGGRVRRIRTRIPFSYGVKCTAGASAKMLKSGVYFVLLDVVQPLGTQIQLYGAIDVDPATGAFAGVFTNADRNPDGTRCPTHCSDIDRCRLLPAQECVAPSVKAGTTDEYSDFVPNVDPPTGYSFPVEGCAIDNGNGAGVVTAPATMVVVSPPVTVEGLTMTAFFGPDAKGAVRATGSLTADTVLLGGNVVGNGKGNGSMTAVYIPDAQVPPGVPRPAKPVIGADAGASGGTDAGR